MPPNYHERFKENQQNFLSRILYRSFKMPSYFRCAKDSRKVYIVSFDSNWYTECIRASRNIKCDIWGSSKSKWRKLKQIKVDLSLA